MHKIVSQIRDLEIIEEELKSNQAGVLALIYDGDKITQLTTTFLYMDKNIYIFFHKDDELYDNLQFESNAIFSILKQGKIKKIKNINFEPTYNILSITIKGIMKKIDDPKLLEEAKSNYILKYKRQSGSEVDYSPISKVILIDTEEIQASEETGG